MLKFKSFAGDIKSKCQAELQGFTRKVRLEKFYFEEISIQKYEKIAEFLKVVLTLTMVRVLWSVVSVIIILHSKQI